MQGEDYSRYKSLVEDSKNEARKNRRFLFLFLAMILGIIGGLGGIIYLTWWLFFAEQKPQQQHDKESVEMQAPASDEGTDNPINDVFDF